MRDTHSILVVLYAMGDGVVNLVTGIDSLRGGDHAMAAAMGIGPVVTAMGVLSILLGGAMILVGVGVMADRRWAYGWAVLVFGATAMVRFLTVFVFGNLFAVAFIPIDVAVARWGAKQAA